MSSSGATGDDNSGSGVQRTVIDQALKTLTSEDHPQDLFAESGNSDGYTNLNVGGSIDMASKERDHYFFAAGVLAMLALVAGQAPPLPISPSLVLWALRGIDAVLDDTWIQHAAPHQWRYISQIPLDHHIRIPFIVPGPNERPASDHLYHFMSSRMSTRVSVRAILVHLPLAPVLIDSLERTLAAAHKPSQLDSRHQGQDSARLR